MIKDNNQTSREVLDLKELFFVIWDEIHFIVKFTTSFALLSILYALLAQPLYESRSIVTIAENQTDILSSSGLSGLASIAGVSLGSAGNDKTQEVIETIKSRAFFKHLLTFDKVLPSIMAADSFEKDSKELIFNDKYQLDKWTDEAPTYLEAYEIYINSVLKISQDKLTGMITITVEHISPNFAYEFLKLIIDETNNLLRQKDLKTATDALDFLKTELSKTSLVEIKGSINQLIQAQLETQMLARVNKDYVLKSIEPPFIPEARSYPKRTLLVIMGTMIGGIISILIVLIREYGIFPKSDNS